MTFSKKPLSCKVLLLALTLSFSLMQTGFAEPSFPSLVEALRNYNTWDAIQAEDYTQGSSTTLRPDVPYKNMMQAFEKISYDRYPDLVLWAKENKNRIPSPAYMHLATKGMTLKVPKQEFLKWYAVSTLLARYDLQQCVVQGKNTNATALALEHTYFPKMMQEDMTTAKAAMKDAYQYLSGMTYATTPMWACANNDKTVKTVKEARKNEQTETDITKADLVHPEDKIKTPWGEYITSLGKMFKF